MRVPGPGGEIGRRGGLKIRYPKGCVGSSPTPGTDSQGSGVHRRNILRLRTPKPNGVSRWEVCRLDSLDVRAQSAH
jgi:hypothetical protein